MTKKKGMKSVITKKGVSGMNSSILLKWAMHFTTMAKSGDLLIWDNLGSHSDAFVIGLLTSKGINIEFIPARCADRLSILDYSWFSLFKRELECHIYNSIEEKKEIIYRVFYSLLGNKVTCFFRKIGYYNLFPVNQLS